MSNLGRACIIAAASLAWMAWPWSPAWSPAWAQPAPIEPSDEPAQEASPQDDATPPEGQALTAPEPAASEPSPAPAAQPLEEIICDPENPSCVQAVEPGPGAQAFEASDEQVICDPENPSCPGASASPALRATREGSPGPAPASGPTRFESVQVQASYGTSMAMDLSYDRANEDVVEWSTGLDLQIAYDMDLRTRFVVQGQLRHWAAGKENLAQPDWGFNAWDKRAVYDAIVGESYVLKRLGGGYTLRVGNLLTPWGSTDLTRPIDLLNPSDLRALGSNSPGAYQPRLAQLAAEGVWSGQGWAWQVVLMPVFVPDRVALTGRDSALVAAALPALSGRLPAAALLESAFNQLVAPDAWPVSSEQAPGYPQALPSHMSAATRLTGTLWNTDWGVGYLFGWDRTPLLTPDPDAQALLALASRDGQVLADLDLAGFLARNPEAAPLVQRLIGRAQAGQPLLEAEFKRRHTLAFDLARYIGPVGVRADLALTAAQTQVSRELETFRAPTIHGALGLSYETFGDDYQLALTAEAFSQRVLTEGSWWTKRLVPARERARPGARALIVGEHLWGAAAAAVFAQTQWQLEASLGGVWNISNEDMILNARISKRFSSQARLTLGAMLYHGPAPDQRITLGGLLDANDHVYLGLDGSL